MGLPPFGSSKHYLVVVWRVVCWRIVSCQTPIAPQGTTKFLGTIGGGSAMGPHRAPRGALRRPGIGGAGGKFPWTNSCQVWRVIGFDWSLAGESGVLVLIPEAGKTNSVQLA